MSLLIRDIDELKEYYPIAHTDKAFGRIRPFIREAQRDYLAETVGRATVDALIAGVAGTSGSGSGSSEGSGSGSGSSGGSGCGASVLDAARDACAWMAIYLALPHIEVEVSLLGTSQMGSQQDRQPIFSGQRTQLRLAALQGAMNRLEGLVAALEDNTTGPCADAWRASDARMDWKTRIIPNARIFSQYWGSMGNRHITYMGLLAHMNDVEELLVARMLGKPLMAELRTQLNSGSISPANTELLMELRPMVAKLTAARGMPTLMLHIEAFGIYSYLTEKNEKNSDVLARPQRQDLEDMRKRLLDEGEAQQVAVLEMLQAGADAKWTLFKQSRMYKAPGSDEQEAVSAGGIRGFF